MLNMRSNLLMKETTRVKISEYSPDAMASKHSRAMTLEPDQQSPKTTDQSQSQQEPHEECQIYFEINSLLIKDTQSTTDMPFSGPAWVCRDYACTLFKQNLRIVFFLQTLSSLRQYLQK